MKILLLQDVKKLGKAGDIVDVSDGYAKNFIMPQKLGKEATKEVLNEWKLKKGSEANRREQEKQAAIAQAEECGLLGDHILQREHDAGQLTAGGNLLQGFWRLSRVGGDEELHRILPLGP